MLLVRTRIAALAVVLTLFVPVVFAQGFIQIDRLTHLDVNPTSDSNAHFGQALALAEDLVVIGAPHEEDPDGAVYVARLEADASLTYLNRIDPGVDNTSNFGQKLDADGDWAAIYEYLDNVLLFQRAGDGFVLRQKLNPLPNQNGIEIRGVQAIAMQGDTLVLGNTYAHVPGGSGAGAAAVYRRNGTTWSLEALLPSPDPGSTDDFGMAVAVSGNLLVIGAPRADASNGGPSGSRFGRAWVYRRNNTTWSLEATLDGPVSDHTDGGHFGSGHFGHSVTIDGDTAVVGCLVCNIQAGSPGQSGSFHVFRRNAGGPDNWGWVQEVSASNATYLDEFSRALRLRDNLLQATAPGGARSAYLLAQSPDGLFTEVALLQSTDDGSVRFGVAADFDGVRSIVGASSFPNTGPAPDRYGAVYSFTNPAVQACHGSFDAIFCDGFGN